MTRMTVVFSLALTLALASQLRSESKFIPINARESLPGRRLFEKNCAPCHEHGTPRAPAKGRLMLMSANRIYSTLTTGVMRAEAARLSPEELRQIAQYLSGMNPGKSEARVWRCENDAGWLDAGATPVGTGWGITADNARTVPAAQAHLTSNQLGKLQLSWAFRYPDSIVARSQPTIVGDALFVGSPSGAVYAMDARRGCIHWTFHAASDIKGGIVYRKGLTETGEVSSGKPTVFFADSHGVYAVDAPTGALQWNAKITDDPLGTIGATPVLSADGVYVPLSGDAEESLAAASDGYVCCTFRGSIVKLDRRTGALLWKRFTIAAGAVEHYEDTRGQAHVGPAGAGVWSTPALDEKRAALYFTTGNNYSGIADDNSDAIFAISATTGALLWKTQARRGDTFNISCIGQHIESCPEKPGPDVDFTAPPVLARGTGGRDILLAAQKSGDIFGLNPEDGKVVWHQRISQDPNPWGQGIWFGMAAQDGHLFVPMIGLQPVDSPQHGTETHSPFDGLHMLDAFTGKLLWSAPVSHDCDKASPCGGVQMAPLAIPGVIFAGSVDGYMRAYDAHSGTVLWSFDTARSFHTPHEASAAAGGMIFGNGGVMVGDGRLFVNSFNLQTGSAVLLAFSVR